MNSGNAERAKDQDIHERMKLVEALSRLASGSNDNNFSQSIDTYLRDLADLFKADFAFIGLFGDDSQSWIKTLRVYAKGQFGENFTYSLKDTPCNDVLDRKIEIINSNVAKKYPADKMLVEMSIESYYGAPLISPSHASRSLNLALLDLHFLPLIRKI